jgi:cell division FtsZ-interacting protein ZapD
MHDSRYSSIDGLSSFYEIARYEYVATNQAEIAECLKDANFRSVEELMAALEKSEEQLFVLFNDTQVEEERMEALAAENKHLEQEVEIQVNNKVTD